MRFKADVIPLKAGAIVFRHQAPGGESSLPILIYQIKNDTENLYYAEVLPLSQVGSGRNIEEALEDLSDSVKWYLKEAFEDPDNTVVVLFSPEKFRLYKRLLPQKQKTTPNTEYFSTFRKRESLANTDSSQFVIA
ncbi:hypothetical protein EHO60_12150 [Leptospira fletcheri]|uniref:Uncharacterized protein n=1 Tax=Leptospira fletcheri TaxID=2484981 RepID=A0A4R9GAL1_9LEPT|nr:hypothetical protein [Leptospira fletcheri]TGK08796.1 hypothetical protein EHO60_12150 [Leptospira fletcheri]